MARVLVLGSSGMLGEMVMERLSRDLPSTVDGCDGSRKNSTLRFEVADGVASLRSLVDKNGPYEYVINCIEVTEARIDPRWPSSTREAISINALFPFDLAALALEVGARVVHMSTDGVFMGSSAPFYEDDATDCCDVYGRTKSLGEVRAAGFLTIRCSIVSPDPAGGRGLIEWLRRQPAGARVMGYADHLWNGVTSWQVAELGHGIVISGSFDAIHAESPIHHFCPNRPVSKYDLLAQLAVRLRPDIAVVPSVAPKGRSTGYSARATSR